MVLVPTEFHKENLEVDSDASSQESQYAASLLPEFLPKYSLSIVLTVLRVSVGFSVFTAWSWLTDRRLLIPSSLCSQLQVSHGCHTPSTREFCFFQR